MPPTVLQITGGLVIAKRQLPRRCETQTDKMKRLSRGDLGQLGQWTNAVKWAKSRTHDHVVTFYSHDGTGKVETPLWNEHHPSKALSYNDEHYLKYLDWCVLAREQYLGFMSRTDSPPDNLSARTRQL